MNHHTPTRRKLQPTQAGQALVALLAFMAIALTLTTAATVVALVNVRTTTTYSLGQEALRFADAGADNALLRLLRNPQYTGETLPVGNGTATISVSGSGTKLIVSEGVSGNLKRTIQVTVTTTNNTLTVTSWNEVP